GDPCGPAGPRRTAPGARAGGEQADAEPRCAHSRGRARRQAAGGANGRCSRARSGLGRSTHRPLLLPVARGRPEIQKPRVALFLVRPWIPEAEPGTAVPEGCPQAAVTIEKGRQDAEVALAELGRARGSIGELALPVFPHVS